MAFLPSKPRRASRRRVPLERAYFVLNGAQRRSAGRKAKKIPTYTWFDVALTMELKKDDTRQTCEDNSRNVIRNIQQVMARDPCRRFSFGITVENTNMRLWFCSRATPVVSKPFDFTMDLALLLHVLLSFAFASKDELGWDSTIRPIIKSDGKRAYHIDVDGQTYETMKVLADDAAEELVSHATRVWSATHLDSGELFVLKDVWIEDDRDLEHCIREKLLYDIEDKYGADVRKEVASHLLTPVANWLVFDGNKQDHTTSNMMRGFSPSFRQTFKVDIRTLRARNDDGIDTLPCTDREDMRCPLPWYNPVRKIFGRKHYRVVFKEVTTALHTINDFASSFIALSDSSRVLKWIHGCGWVHRDISAGNLYFYDGRGLIGDLEFAKRKNTDLKHELRTGTPDFMAVEAARRSYEYLPRIVDDDLDAELEALCEGRVDEVYSKPKPDPTPAFFHNDLHDLESLWWSAVWILFCECSSSSTGGANSCIDGSGDQRNCSFSKLFSRTSNTEDRKLFTESRANFNQGVAWMPDHLRDLIGAIDFLRMVLVRKYVAFEAGFPRIQTDAFEGIHEIFQNHFKRCSEIIAEIRLSSSKADGQRLQRTDVEHASAALPFQSKTEPTELEASKSRPLDLMTDARNSEPMIGDAAAQKHIEVRKGKRKREDKEDLPHMRPFRMARPATTHCLHPTMSSDLPLASSLETGTSTIQKSPTTPKNPRRWFRLTEDSPVKIHSTLGRGYQLGTLDSRRVAVAEDVDHAIPEIPLESFMEHLLPPLKDGLDVNKVVASLAKQDTKLFTRKGKLFNDFRKEPVHNNACESDVFAPLATICKRICECASEILGEEQTCQLELRPDYTPWSERNSSTRPTAYFVLKALEWYATAVAAVKAERSGAEPKNSKQVKKPPSLSWYDILFHGELKKGEMDEDRVDNGLKLLHSLQHVMTLDACRRFVFGFTVENTSMRLWFASRAKVLVTEKFNFTRSVNVVAHIFLSIAFASKEEMGWDLSVRPFFGVNKKRAYYIDVGSTTYETVEVISDLEADVLNSSATRIWKVRLPGTNSFFYLKDIWVEEGRRLEKTIHDMILEDVERTFGAETRKDTASLMLTPMDDWLVRANGEDDHTTRVMMRGYTPCLENVYHIKKRYRSDNSKKSVGLPSAADTDIHDIQVCIRVKTLEHRKHYRVVFAQCAQPIHTLRKLSDAFIVLKDGATALKWIHGSGWVHRGLGADSLYFNSGRGLIGDFEYAKRKNSEAAHKKRTALADFMANEVIAREYRYRPIEQVLEAGQKPAFCSNDLHDLESLWWTAIYHLFMNRDVSEAKMLEHKVRMITRGRNDAALTVFPRSKEISERLKFLDQHATFSKLVSWMPEKFKDIKEMIDHLRKQLVRRYMAFEKDLSVIRMDAFQGSQEAFKIALEQCVSYATGIETSPCKTTALQLLDVEQDEEDWSSTLVSLFNNTSESSQSGSGLATNADAEVAGKRKQREDDLIKKGKQRPPLSSHIRHVVELILKVMSKKMRRRSI
ncbi:hypothetical protein A7U60_g2129 [Sanghuangporus baumii]|uniref:Fungal-type protein kinase domain-containing protein n=1 Tax=Sanghuangporus baumii TaxID=108892 RepID=A0A9Q5I2Q8_SANBA|nr:hypothetical protein A7U60_g2129 [Sanghuangporus baumii]